MLIWCRSSLLGRTKYLIKWITQEEPGFDGYRNSCKASWVSPCLSSTRVAFSSTPLVSCLIENPSILLVSKQPCSSITLRVVQYMQQVSKLPTALTVYICGFSATVSITVNFTSTESQRCGPVWCHNTTTPTHKHHNLLMRTGWHAVLMSLCF